ncbi:MAG: hypothetical protein AAF063_19300 [Cyanobacteria bacterium J06643_5]
MFQNIEQETKNSIDNSKTKNPKSVLESFGGRESTPQTFRKI